MQQQAGYLKREACTTPGLVSCLIPVEINLRKAAEMNEHRHSQLLEFSNIDSVNGQPRSSGLDVDRMHQVDINPVIDTPIATVNIHNQYLIETKTTPNGSQFVQKPVLESQGSLPTMDSYSPTSKDAKGVRLPGSNFTLILDEVSSDLHGQANCHFKNKDQGKSASFEINELRMLVRNAPLQKPICTDMNTVKQLGLWHCSTTENVPKSILSNRSTPCSSRLRKNSGSTMNKKKVCFSPNVVVLVYSKSSEWNE